MREDERDRVARQGTAAWKRLKSSKSWSDWLAVGEALQVGREWSMNQAGVNKPEGKGYNMAFGEWLAKYKLDDMDKSDRARLFDVMDNLPMIEEWRQTLTLSERLKLNHPTSVLRKWKAAIEPEKPKSDKPTLKDSVVNLSEENDRLKLQIAELEAAREALPAAAAATAPKGNPLQGRNAGEIVDLVLQLPASTVKAIVHDLVRETTKTPKAQPESEAAGAWQEDAEPAKADDPEQGLHWTGDDEQGYLGRGLVDGEHAITYTVTPVNFRGSEHFEANIITNPNPDLTLPVRRLADHHGMSLRTRDPRGRRRTLDPVPTVAEAKAQCEADYAQQ